MFKHILFLFSIIIQHYFSVTGKHKYINTDDYQKMYTLILINIYITVLNLYGPCYI